MSYHLSQYLKPQENESMTEICSSPISRLPSENGFFQSLDDLKNFDARISYMKNSSSNSIISTSESPKESISFQESNYSDSSNFLKKPFHQQSIAKSESFLKRAFDYFYGAGSQIKSSYNKNLHGLLEDSASKDRISSNLVSGVVSNSVSLINYGCNEDNKKDFPTHYSAINWICSLCLNSNFDGLLCSVCKNPKPIEIMKDSNLIVKKEKLSLRKKRVFEKPKNKNYETEKSQNKKGDWFCALCFNINYSFRKNCNRCDIPREVGDKGIIDPLSCQNYIQLCMTAGNPYLINPQEIYAKGLLDTQS